LFISFYNNNYNQIKNTIYQIPKEPNSKKWCNIIAIYRPYYKINEPFKLYYKLFSNIFWFIYGKVNKNWVVFENLIEFNDVFSLTVSEKENNIFNLSNVETVNAKKNVDFLKTKYSHLSDPCLKYNLFILKNNEYYFTKLIYYSNLKNLTFSNNSLISNINFFTIEYVHPSLKTPLLIDLSNFKFAVKSHILGFLFIYWYLRNKYGNWADCIFDMNYKLNIIDNGFYYFEITAFEFIMLEENNYSVERIFSLLKKNNCST